MSDLIQRLRTLQPADSGYAEIGREAASEIERLRAWLESIHDITDEEIAVRFRTSSQKTEEQMAGKSVVYTMLSIPRNIAKRALNGDPYILPVPLTGAKDHA
jgi:hypothetical protein